MPYLAIPNVSEGRDEGRIQRMIRTLRAEGATVLDVHSDAIHHRSVFTLTAPTGPLRSALTKLAGMAMEIRLDRHEGVHPRLGALDVCPIVPHETPMSGAVTLAHEVGGAIHDATGLPVYFYGEAANRPETRELRDIRRGGLNGLIARAGTTLPPDLGGPIDSVTGVVCVGAREPLIAFNVTVRSGLEAARAIAASVRETSGGLPGVRALAFRIAPVVCQISMNLTLPQRGGIDEAFDAVAASARNSGIDVMGCEVVGLVPQRFLPDPKKQAARLLKQPDLCLETRLLSSSS
jgi:glutamate formiminotransferase